EWRGIRKLERHVAFPFRLEWSDVHQNPAAGVGAFAQADCEYVSRDAEVFNGACERKAVWWNYYELAFDVDKVFLIKLLRINYGAVEIGEEFEFVGATNVVTITRGAVRNDSSAVYLFNLARLERLDHLF